MNDADRSLLQRAIDAISGRDPAREALNTVIQEHGREAVAKAAGTLLPETDLTGLSEQDVADLEAAVAAATSVRQPPADEKPQWAKDLEAKVEQLAQAEPAEPAEQPVTTDELALAKMGVPIEDIEAARPMLRSTDSTVAQAAAQMLAKSLKPTNHPLLAKEKGSATVPSDKAEADRLKSILAKADGAAINGHPQTPVEQLLSILQNGAQG